MTEQVTSAPAPRIPPKDEKGQYFVFEETTADKVASLIAEERLNARDIVLVVRSDRAAAGREEAITDFVAEEDAADRWKEGTTYCTLAKRYIFQKAPKRKTSYV